MMICGYQCPEATIHCSGYQYPYWNFWLPDINIRKQKPQNSGFRYPGLAESNRNQKRTKMITYLVNLVNEAYTELSNNERSKTMNVTSSFAAQSKASQTMNFLFLTIQCFQKWRRQGHSWIFKNISGVSHNWSGGESNCHIKVRKKQSTTQLLGP